MTRDVVSMHRVFIELLRWIFHWSNENIFSRVIETLLFFIKENFLKVEKVSSYTIEKITSKLLGKRVRFTSDCELFPNFDVKVQVISVSISQNREILFDCRNISNRKKLVIGSNMRNLKFQILS